MGPFRYVDPGIPDDGTVESCWTSTRKTWTKPALRALHDSGVA